MTTSIAPNPVSANFTLSVREFEQYRRLIAETTGISLSDNKLDLLSTRLRKRMRAIGVGCFSEYYGLAVGPTKRDGELEELINCVTTNKTEFFREAHHFTFLEEYAFPELVEKAKKSGSRKMRIWSAACSKGHEPYTIAMTVRDYFESLPGWDTKILASDVDSACLKTAAEGRYDEGVIDPLSEVQRNRYFLRGTGASAGKVAAKRELKDLITFRRINFVEPKWPIRCRFDVIFCRNALIYFEPEFQEQLISRFVDLIEPGGYLILGHSENASNVRGVELVGKTVYRVTGSSGAAGRAPSRPASAPIKQAAKPKPKPKPKRRPIVAGEFFASKDPIEITTLLGSCIAACLYDPKARVGGMNHFLLPEGIRNEQENACYGINAMELLINELMMRGGARDRMQARLYGGASIMSQMLSSSHVGEKNIKFVKDYLDMEGIPIIDQKVGGTSALRVSMLADSGRVSVSALDGNSAKQLAKKDVTVATETNQAAKKHAADHITMF